MPEDKRPPDALSTLSLGDIEVKGRMPWSSNGTYLVAVCHDGTAMDAVYKPIRGERPLWDFPPGLYRREIAAYEVSEALGWGIVSETIVRHDAPLGPGSLQRFVPADFTQHYFTLLDDPTHHAALLRIAVFDLIINNADRKSGHCLLGEDGRIWAIDHGVAFADHPKLRTVIWDFAGEVIPAELTAAVTGIDTGALAARLTDLLDPTEIEALVLRIGQVARLRSLPDPDPDRRPYPWPLV